MLLSIELLLILFFAALLASIVDTISGGGGLITVPILVIVGLPPDMALATNKVQGSAGTLCATAFFVHKKIINIKQMSIAVLFIVIGSVLGTLLVLQVDSNTLIALLPILLILAGCYYLFSKKIQNIDTKPVIPLLLFSVTLAPLIGFYDGFFGPGAGSLYTLVLISLCGFSAGRATGNAKLLNFASNISSCMYYVFFGRIAWGVSILMIAGQFIGVFIGGHIVLKKGASIIKWLSVVVCFVMSIRILWQRLM